jgi:hypothetical protein
MTEKSIIDERYVEIIKQIKRFDCGEETSKRIDLIGLNNKERYKLYGFIETSFNNKKFVYLIKTNKSC